MLHGNSEARGTLTHVSMQGGVYGVGPELSLTMEVVITPAYMAFPDKPTDEATPVRPTRCELRVPEGNEAARLRTTLAGRQVEFTSVRLGDVAHFRFDLDYRTVDHALEWAKSVLPHVTFDSPQYWLALERGPNVDPLIFMKAVEDVPTDLEVHQNLVVEEEAPDAVPFTEATWAEFQANLLTTGDFHSVHVHPTEEVGVHYLELVPTPIATRSLEALAHLVISNCPRPRPGNIPRQRVPSRR